MTTTRRNIEVLYLAGVTAAMIVSIAARAMAAAAARRDASLPAHDEPIGGFA